MLKSILFCRKMECNGTTLVLFGSPLRQRVNLPIAQFINNLLIDSRVPTLSHWKYIYDLARGSYLKIQGYSGFHPRFIVGKWFHQRVAVNPFYIQIKGSRFFLFITGTLVGIDLPFSAFYIATGFSPFLLVRSLLCFRWYYRLLLLLCFRLVFRFYLIRFRRFNLYILRRSLFLVGGIYRLCCFFRSRCFFFNRLRLILHGFLGLFLGGIGVS